MEIGVKKYWNSPSEAKRQKAENYYEALFGNRIIKLENVKKRSHDLAKQIRDVIEPVIIRRNRLDLQKNPFYKKEVEHLSKLDDPQEWYFELSKEQSEYYDRIIKECFGDPEDGGFFKGAIYKPFEYEVDRKKVNEEKLTEKENFQYIQQKNLYDFMRRLIVKRFESSFGSFEQSIRNFKKITENALKFIEKTNEYILDRGLLEKIYELDEEEIEKHLEDYAEKINNNEYPKNHKRYKLDDFDNKKEFIDDINSDLNLFDTILDELSQY